MHCRTSSPSETLTFRFRQVRTGSKVAVTFSDFCSFQHKCHLWSLLEYQCNSGSRNIIFYHIIPGKHKMLSKLATQSFNILRLIARNPNFLRPKVPYFNVSRLSRLHEVICIYVFRHTSLFMPLYRNIFLYMGIYAYCLWIWKSESMMNQLTNWHG